jgi:hypothetical protein
VLDERDCGGGVVPDGLVERPKLVLELATIGVLVARGVEPGQRAHHSAGALAGGEVGAVQALDDILRVLVNDQQVDDAHDVALTQPLQLGEHPRR